MFNRTLFKPLLGAMALAATTALVPSAPAQAQESCAAYARDVAASEAPRRGIIDGLVIGTLDTVFTGGAGADERYRDAYNDAYRECADRTHVAVLAPAHESVAVVARPEPGTAEWLSYCSARYRSFDPDTGMFVTYSGEQLPCR
jgi:hypothetical protein